MGFLSSTNDEQTERVVLATSVIASVLALVFDLWLNEGAFESWIRSFVYATVAVFSLLLMRWNSRAQLLQIYLATVFAGMSLIDSASGSSVALVDPGVTLTLLVLLAVTYLGVRDKQTERPIKSFVLSISAFSVITVILGDYTTTHALGFLLVGVVGQTLVLWVVYQLINSLGESSAVEAKHARIQEALAHCSQALLNRGTPEPLSTALTALLNATDADYAYIDVNRTDAAGVVTWEIVAEAVGDNFPDVDKIFENGDYSQQDEMLDLLRRGHPARVLTRELPMPLRERYEREGIKSELIAPIMIGDRWIGTMGYTDHIREGDWDDIEVKALMRAAEMVGAYWEREAAREGLMELAQAKDRFIAAVSHELRTPLSAVVGFAGALAQGTADYSPEEVAEMTSTIYHQSLELTHLVDDLLTSERAASGNLTVKPAALYLLKESESIVASTITDFPVTISGEEVVAYGDTLRTRQIIRNLLTNAVRYGGGTISLEVKSDGSTATVTVRDDGKGVSHLDADRIFDPYYRSQDGRSTPDSVGLGLAVARQLARLMGGDVLYRRRNGWTSFEFSLPLATEEPIIGDLASNSDPDLEGGSPNPHLTARGVRKETVTVASSRSKNH